MSDDKPWKVGEIWVGDDHIGMAAWCADDPFSHKLADENCPCDPTITPLVSGKLGVMISHNDMRERTEVQS